MTERPLFDPARVHVPGSERTASAPLAIRLTPTRVNELIRGAVHRHVPSTLHVLGEIGDLSRAGSGHLYFTLKDATSELRCVMWRSAASGLKFQVAAGMELIATGTIEVYSARGTYQLMVRALEPRGVGALELALRQLKDKLEREGLLDSRRKRPLPKIPRRVALVTSPGGAAIRDILKTLARRFPSLEVLVVPVRVQGDGAADDIARAIRLLNQHADGLGGVDVAIVGRGGGSLEDLWAFNEEVVARAIVASRIIIVSAVGHEIDVSISDLVADVRAATPTAAAELVAPLLAELLEHLDRQRARGGRALGHTIQHCRSRLDRAVSRGPLVRPLARVAEHAQGLDERANRLARGLMQRCRREHVRLNRAETIIARFGAGATFARLAQHVQQRAYRAGAATQRLLGRAGRHITITEAKLREALPAGRLARFDEHVRSLNTRLIGAAARLLLRRRDRLAARAAVLEACGPRRILLRGYSITRDARTGRILRSIADLKDNQRITTELADGRFHATAEDPRQPRLFE